MSSGSTQQQNKLPANWKWTKLGDVCHAIRGVTFKSGDSSTNRYDGSIPCVTTSAVQSVPDWNTSRYIPASYVRNANQYLQSGDILVSTANSKALVGKSCLVTQVPESCVFGAFVTVLRPANSILASWLTYALQRDEAKEYFYSSSSNTTNISNLKTSDLLDHAIPLPPLPEQNRIVAVLNEQMAVVERAKKAAQERLEAARALQESLREHTLNLAGFQYWPEVPLGKVGVITSGITLGRKLRPDVVTQRRQYLRVANVKDGYLDLTEVKEATVTGEESKKHRLEAGDLLLTEGGDPDKLGRGCVWDGEIPNCLHQNHIFKVRFDQSQVNPRFVSCVVGSAYGKAYFFSKARQTTGIATINRGILESFPLRLPSVKQQDDTVAILDDSVGAITPLIDTTKVSLEAIESISAVLLRQAFSGKLG